MLIFKYLYFLYTIFDRRLVYLSFSFVVLSFIASFSSTFSFGLYAPILTYLTNDQKSDNFIIRFSHSFFKMIGVEFNLTNLLIVATIAILLGEAVNFFVSLLSSLTVRHTSIRGSNQIFRNIINKDYKFFQNEKSGYLLDVIAGQVGGTCSIAIGTNLQLLIGLVTTTIFAVSLVVLSAKLTLFAIFFGLMYFLSTYIFSIIMQKLSRESIESGQQLGLFYTETVIGIKTIKSMGYEQHRFEESKGLVEKVQYYGFKGGLIHISKAFVENTIISLFFAFFIYFSIEVLDFPVSELLFFLVILTKLYLSIRGINEKFLSFAGGVGALENVLKYLDEKPERTSHKPFFNFSKEIYLKNISFTYNQEKDVFKNFSLKVYPREFIALVGPSGGGKSTLVDLILGIQGPTSGQVLYDGNPLNFYNKESWCKNIGIVSQDIFLFHNTIFNNIVYGDTKPDRDRVMQVLEIAYCMDFISEMKEKEQTIIGDRGLKLSGGQRQRIALARALYHQPKLLILDEATSALDSISEKYIQESLQKIHGQMAIIAIAHRLSTIKKADKIYYIENGIIKEEGNHQELIQQNGLYKELKTIQLDD